MTEILDIRRQIQPLKRGAWVHRFFTNLGPTSLCAQNGDIEHPTYWWPTDTSIRSHRATFNRYGDPATEFVHLWQWTFNTGRKCPKFRRRLLPYNIARLNINSNTIIPYVFVISCMHATCLVSQILRNVVMMMMMLMMMIIIIILILIIIIIIQRGPRSSKMYTIRLTFLSYWIQKNCSKWNTPSSSDQSHVVMPSCKPTGISLYRHSRHYGRLSEANLCQCTVNFMKLPTVALWSTNCPERSEQRP
jgi:hypothetical protein